jgi:hypothetical protein
VKAFRQATTEERQQIFQVGTLVPSYGQNMDVVLAYTELDDGVWGVTVKGSDGRTRSHSTNPEIVNGTKLLNNPNVTMIVNGLAVHRR